MVLQLDTCKETLEFAMGIFSRSANAEDVFYYEAYINQMKLFNIVMEYFSLGLSPILDFQKIIGAREQLCLGA